MEIFNELIKNDLWLLQWVACATSIINLIIIVKLITKGKIKRLQLGSIMVFDGMYMRLTKSQMQGHRVTLEFTNIITEVNDDSN